MDPYAQRYGGHQFGNWAGQLGDGRAITLGEVDTGEKKLELQFLVLHLMKLLWIFWKN